MKLTPSKIINYQHIFKNCGYLHIPNYFSQAEINKYKFNLTNDNLINELNTFVNQVNNSHNFLLKTQIKKYDSNKKFYHDIDLFEKKDINYYSTVCIYPNLDINTNIKFTNFKSYKKIQNVYCKDLISLDINKNDLLIYNSFIAYLLENINYISYEFIFIDENEI